MDTEGTLAPATPAEARAEYEALVPAAKVAVREAAKAMAFDRAEYADRVTGDVIETVRDALFASLLRVHVGTRDEYEAWLGDHPEYESDAAGSDNVDNVVWHPVAFPVDDPDVDGERLVVAATWQAEREAALGTLRRRAFGRVYRGVVEASDGDSAGGDDGSDDGVGSDDDDDGDEAASDPDAPDEP